MKLYPGVTAQMYRLEDNLQESVLFLHYVGSGDQVLKTLYLNNSHKTKSNISKYILGHLLCGRTGTILSIFNLTKTVNLLKANINFPPLHLLANNWPV